MKKKVTALSLALLVAITTIFCVKFVPSASEQGGTNTTQLSETSTTNTASASGYWVDEYKEASVTNEILEEWYQSESPTYVDTYTLTITESCAKVVYYAYEYTDGSTYVRIPGASTLGGGSYTFNDATNTQIISGSTYWFKVEPIKWLVLNPTSYDTDGYYYLVADNALVANIPFYTDTSTSGRTNWTNSTIRTWLNEYFVSDAFTSEQQANLNTTTVTNGSTGDTYTYSTTDTAWLLSYEEVVTTYEGILFSSGSTASSSPPLRRVSPTDFALANYCLHSESVTLEGQYSCSWWLRSAHSSSGVRYVYEAGYAFGSNNPTSLYSGVRPALQVNDISIQMTYSSITGRYYIEFGSYPQTYVNDTWLEEVSYPGEGSGTSSDPYIVTTAEELVWFAYYTESGTGEISSSTYIELGADIDLSGKYWTRIGKSLYYFAGNFNGNGHTITGLTIDTSSQYYGLFGYCGSGINIYNLNIDSASVTNIYSYTGILAGYMASSATISNILITSSSINSSSTYVGGIVGFLDKGTVANVVVYADISGSSRVGGGIWICGLCKRLYNYILHV